MLTIPTDILNKYFFEYVNSNDLYHLALVCHDLHKKCYDVANKRWGGMQQFESLLELNDKIYVFLNKENLSIRWNAEVKKVREFLLQFKDKPFKFFSYLSSPSFLKTMQQITDFSWKGLSELEQKGTQEDCDQKDVFYSEYDCTDESSVSSMIDFLTSYELRDHKEGAFNCYIWINPGRNFLSTGNLASFLNTQKQFSLNKTPLNVQRHDDRSIIILYTPVPTKQEILSESLQNAIPSKTLIDQCKTQMSLLTDLHVLDIRVLNNYDPKTRSCLLSLLEGTISLQQLMAIFFEFNHEISDDHIHDISTFMEHHFTTHHQPIITLRIECVNISNEQIKTLIKNLEKGAKRQFQLVIIAPSKIYTRIKNITHSGPNIIFRARGSLPIQPS